MMRSLQRGKSVVEFAQQSQEGEMRELFARADVNKRDRITKPELAKLLASLHVEASDTGVNVLFQALDTNRDGVITVDEFCAGFRLLGEAGKRPSAATTSSSARLRHLAAAYDKVTFQELFRAVDANGDGKISRDELKHVLEIGGHPVDAEEFEALWKAFDVNADGGISEAEFHHGLIWINVYVACSVTRDPAAVLTEICRTLIANTADTAKRASDKGQGKTAKAIAGIVDLPVLLHAESFLAEPLLDAAVRKTLEDILSANNN